METKGIVQLSSRRFLAGCLAVSVGLVLLSLMGHSLPPLGVAVEVFLVVVALFVLGSIRYRLDKNALTYGALMVIIASFWGGVVADVVYASGLDS